MALEPPADWSQRPNTTVQSPSHCTLTGFRDQSATAARSGVGPADAPAVNDLPFWEWRWATLQTGCYGFSLLQQEEDDSDFFRLDLRSVLLLLSQSTKIEKKSTSNKPTAPVTVTETVNVDVIHSFSFFLLSCGGDRVFNSHRVLRLLLYL